MTRVPSTSKQTVIFVHTFRTGGTTLYRIIDRNVARDSLYTIPEDGTVEGFKRLPDSDKCKIHVLRGHLGFGLHQYMPQPCAYVTLLRDPVERTLSYYAYIRQTPNHYCHPLICDNQMSLEDFIRSRQDLMLDNIHTRFLSGLETGHEVGFGQCTQAMLQAAKRNLHENFTVVGLTEEFDATLVLLQRAFGWRRLAYVRHNTTAHSPSSRTVSRTTLNAIAQVNTLDIELYEYARILFAQQVSRQGASFAQAVREFQVANQRLGPWIGLYWQARRVSVRTRARQLLSPSRECPPPSHASGSVRPSGAPYACTSR